jgi:hypothetical protein
MDIESSTTPSAGSKERTVDRRNEPVRCRICSQRVASLLDFGPQPICNRYLKTPNDSELRHPLRLGQCTSCGLLQLIEPVAAVELKPVHPLRYTEPERHLDQVANLVSSLPGVESNSQICGVTAKDQSMMDRLMARGFQNARCLHPYDDLGIEDRNANVETIQDRISGGVLQNRATHCNRYQLVIARHDLEHAHQLAQFINGVRSLLAPSGYLIFEVPDFTTSLLSNDYSALWEEHVVYFTRLTLVRALRQWGFTICDLQLHAYTPEDSLMAIVRTSIAEEEACLPEFASDSVAQELALGREYANRLPEVRRRWRDMLLESGPQVALLGAGHLGITFLDLLELGDVLNLVLDDDTEKCGYYLPGSHKLVSHTAELYNHPVDLCLLSVSPEGEEKVLRRHQAFLDRGGRFRSIFPGSRLACFPNPDISAVRD